MKRRKRDSGGQALVLVTLALLAMAGMMGVPVDLGWSFFVEKQAQAAADGAALSAVQEAVVRVRGLGMTVSAFSCGGTGAGNGGSQVDCVMGATSCASIAAASNLNNGCQYALRNGFNWTAGSRQNVTMQSNDYASFPPPTAPGVVNISYWVTVRTVQTIPQLFSAILGNTQGTVSAVATAAIAGSIKPGSFFGMDRAGDCLTGADAGNCGMDVITGHGRGNGKNGSQACGPNAISSDLCAPAGIILASSCNSTSTHAQGCDQPAGQEQGSAAVASSFTVMGPAGDFTGTKEDLTGAPATVVNSQNPQTFQDPTAPNGQPPLATSGSNIGTCAIPHQAGAQVTLTGVLGPYMYYTYHATAPGNIPIPDGSPISIGGTATFSQGAGSAGASASCPSISAQGIGSTIQTGSPANQTSANFPTYIFLGGLTNNGTMTLGPGQYVMAGVNTDTGNVFANNGTVDGTSSAAQATGTMFIFTDAAYPGMNLSSNSAANFTPLTGGASGTVAGFLNQGTLGMGNNTTLEMYGLVNGGVSGSNLPASMNAYSGVTWWQDRRNSIVGYNEKPNSPGCTRTVLLTTVRLSSAQSAVSAAPTL